MTVHARTVDHHPDDTPIQRFNKRLALWVTRNVGTVYCFYVFNVVALLSAKSAFETHNLVPIVNWVSSNWIQLVLLPVLIVGQNLQNEAADARAAKTFEDVERIIDALRLDTEGGLKTVYDAVKELHQE